MKMPQGMVLFALTLLATSAEAAPIHLYQFATDVTDSVGSANGTLQGGASVAGGQLVLDGVDDYVQFGSDLVPTIGSFTVSFFANATTTSGLAEFISQGDGGCGGCKAFYIGFQSGLIRAGDNWWTTVSVPSAGSLHHYALTVDATGGGSQSLFVDGILRESRTGSFLISSGTNTRLGAQYCCGEYFSGVLDDVAIYDSALNATEIANIANPNTPVPEPATLVLTLNGVLGIVAARRRRRS